MKSHAILIALLGTAYSATLPHNNAGSAFQPRDSESALSYAPVTGKCPERSQWIRPAHGLSTEEADFVAGRKKVALQGLSAYLKRLNLTGFDLDGYLSKLSRNTTNVPTIGLTISGGGYSSSLTGIGFVRALDDRFAPSVRAKTGGLLQSATYMAGLSGGSWPIMGLATYNFPEIDAMVYDWHMSEPPTPAKPTPHRGDLETMFKQLYEKLEAGFNVSYGDLYGRAGAYTFADGPEGALGRTLSDVQDLSNYKNYGMPFPMWQAAELTYDAVEYFGIKFPSFNETIYEWNPVEFGAWTGPEAFMPIEYLGTKMADGAPVDKNRCVTKFEQVSYVLGLATDAWNAYWIESLSNGTEGAFTKREEKSTAEPSSSHEKRSAITFPLSELEALKKGFAKAFNYSRDDGMYQSLPNPFAKKTSTSLASDPPVNLTIVDGGTIGQTNPVWPLVQPARHTDFIIVWDNDEEAAPYRWTNGATLHQSYVYATNRNIPFPIIPNNATFINQDLISKGTFFGCESNLTNTNDLQAPIIAYFTNYPYSSYTNYSGFQSTFDPEQLAVIMTNSHNIATSGNGTLDSEWPECLACAAIDRSLARLGMDRTPQCQQCMAQHCWNGVEDNSGSPIIDPTLVLDPDMTFAKWNKLTPQNGPFWGEYEGEGA